MKKIFCLLICLIFAATLNAQKKEPVPKTAEPEVRHDYKNGIGIRAGGTSGITFKHFFNPGHAFEGILGIWPNALGITALYEKNTGTGIEGLKFYYGGGAHFTGETGNYYYRTHRSANREYIYRYGVNGYGIGIDGIAGIEYKIGVIPLALSFDLKPYLELSNYGVVFTAIDPALGIKIAF
jgi:hypothetical protein